LPKIAVMNHVSKPLLGLLVATVAFFALWIVALKPSSSSTSGNPGLGRYQSAINAAKATAAAQDPTAAAANALAGGATTSATTPSGAATTAKAAATPPTTTPSSTAAQHASTKTATAKPGSGSEPGVTTPTQRLNAVDRAIADHKVLALLFYNPAAADDQAVKQELRTIPPRSGRVVKVAIPISEVAHYPVVTNQVPVQGSPTLVIVDRTARAFTLVGFATGFEIANRIDDALSTA
jgi:hypothetical protein